jgi:hypothetical protein
MTPLPPLLERTWRDDLKWFAAVMTGVLLGSVVFGADLLLDFLIATVGLIAVLTVVRFALRRFEPRDP